MNLELLKKLVKLANNNPNENEANLAARKVCKIIEEGKFEFTETKQSNTPNVDDFFRQGFRERTSGQYNSYEDPFFRYKSRWRGFDGGYSDYEETVKENTRKQEEARKQHETEKQKAEEEKRRKEAAEKQAAINREFFRNRVRVNFNDKKYSHIFDEFLKRFRSS